MKSDIDGDMPTILIFSRPPNDEVAKSRLRQTLPDDFVTKLHNSFVLDTIDAVMAPNLTCRRVFAWTANENDFPTLRSLVEETHILQEGATFADRLQFALEAVRREEQGNIVVIGSDCPLLSPSILAEALSACREGKLVIGPSNEGGYYLLGIPKEAKLFDLRGTFSTGLEVLTLKNLYSDLPLYLLPTLYDVDIESDLISLIAEIDLRESAELESYVPKRTATLVRELSITRDGDSRGKRIASLFN
ncbi:MAG: DUF2064 domain-containing protein [Bdellovibrionales bacterium]|nr:DUF2064 domain-containing protein [Bdellovibrionales bacterium]